MRKKWFIATPLVLLALAVAAWAAAGPLLLTRGAVIEASVQGQGAEWSLVWLAADGSVVNGRWVEVGEGAVRLEGPVANRGFECLGLRWSGAGVRVADAPAATLVERVLWWESRTALRPGEGAAVLREGVWIAEGQEGMVAWRMPALTVAQVLDIALVYGLLLMGAAAVWGLVRVGDGGRWYTPERAALLLVVAVHAWMAVRAPLLYCPDSMDYAVNAKVLLETGSFEHFNAWRLPGYSVFLAPFVAWLHGWNFGLGVAQGVLGVVTAWLAGRCVGSMLSGPWAALAMVVVGLDPVLLAYERTAMPECLTAFMAMLAVWVALRGTFWGGAGMAGGCAAAAGLGLLLGTACYVRGNMQLLVLLLPVAVAAWNARRGGWARGAVLGGVVLVVGVGCVVPWVVVNAGKYGRAEFVVGSGFTRAQSLVEAGLMDGNQAGVFPRGQAERVDAELKERRLGWERFMGELRGIEGTPVAARTAGMHEWTRLDARAREASAESVARAPAARVKHAFEGAANLLGVWPSDEAGARENAYWSEPLRVWSEPGLNYRVGPEAYGHLRPEVVRGVYDRTVESTAPWTKSDQGGAFQRLWTFGEVARPVWGVLVLVGLVGAVGRRRWALCVVGAAVVAHAAYLSGALHTVIDRYQAPLFPVMGVLAVYGLACLAGAAREAGGAGSRAQADR